jgi:hypothetical protein
MQWYGNQRRTSKDSDDSSMAGQAWQFDYKRCKASWRNSSEAAKLS